MLKPLHYYLVVISFSLFSISTIAQTPCSSGMAGVYPCNNIDLNSFTNLGSTNLNAGSANDIWGWTAPNGTEYALVGLNNGTSFVDITDPNNPVILGKLPAHLSNSTWRDIKVVNDHAYIGSEPTNHGVQIFDLSRLTNVTNPPETFTEDGYINLGKSHNIVANDDTDYIYPVGDNNAYSGGLAFYNVSNPTSPSLEGGYSSAGYSHDAICFIYRGADTQYIGAEICIGFNQNEVVIVDVTDKSDPTTVSLFSYAGIGYCHQGWVTDDHKYLLLDDEFDEAQQGINTTTYTFDISDLDNPVFHYSYVGPSTSRDHNQYVKGPYVYQSNYTSGLRILDISDLDNSTVTEVAYFDNHPANDNATYDGTWSVYPYFKSGKMVMTNIDGAYGGLYIIEPNLPHYVLEVTNIGVETICQGQDAVFTFETTAYSGFSSTDNITVTGVPAGATATLSSNPIPSNGTFTLTVSTDAGVAIGNYNIVLTGTETPVNRVSVGLILTTAFGGLPNVQLVSPTDGASDLPVNITFLWNPVSGATLYDIELSLDPSFNSIAFSAYDLSSTSQSFFGLEGATPYFWRVIAKDNDCATSVGYNVWHFRTLELPVPVELLHFGAKPQEESILLDWQTASEEGFAGFELQRTSDSNILAFKKLAWLDSNNGNSIILQNYRYTDKEVEEGINYYYRLKQVDLDGTEEYSNVVSARVIGKEVGLQVYPNPALDQLTLLLDTEIKSQKVQLTIYNITGQVLISQLIDARAINEGYPLDISNLTQGTYMVSLENKELKESMRFVKR